MRRSEALKLVGTRVVAQTAMNGAYTGVLESLTDDKPWRGRVRIDGVLTPAEAWDNQRGNHTRRGFRPGELLEIGGVNVKAPAPAGRSYLEALEEDLEKLQRMQAQLAERGSRRDDWWLVPSIAARERQIARERDAAAAPATDS